MVNFALLPTAGQSLVSGLHAEYLAGMPQRIAESAYLTPAFKGALQDCYARNPGPKRMADALSFGIIGSELADESRDELRATGGKLFNRARLFSPSPVDYFKPLDLPELVGQLVETLRAGDPSEIVLELVGLERPTNKVLIEKVMTSLFAGSAGQVQAGLFRWPALSLQELSLRMLYGEQAPRFCHAAVDISPTLLNDLHEIGYRMIGTSLAALPFDGREPQSPLEFLFHDMEHTWDYVRQSPFNRRVSCQYLRILEHHLKGIPTAEYSRSQHTANTNIVLGMTRRFILDAQSDMATMSYELPRIFNPAYALRIGRDLLAHIEYDRVQHGHSRPESRQYDASLDLLEEGLEQAQLVLAA